MRKRNLYCLVVFVLVLTAYTLTLCPSVYTGDSGEFITAASVLGIAHPPGYPLYSLLGKAFITLVPVGSIAWKVNFMSAFFAALAALLICLVMQELTGRNMVSAITGLCAGFSKTLWSQAVTAEVYTLNAFFMMLLLYFIMRWRKEGIKWLYAAAFIFGLSLCNHYIMVLFIPAYMYFVIAESREKTEVSMPGLKELAGILMFFTAGLAFYSYMIIRSSANPPLDWGNPETLAGFISHIRRVQYKAMEFGTISAITTRFRFVGHLIRETMWQYTPVLLIPAIIGAWKLFKRDRVMLVTTVLVYLFNSIGLIFLLNFPYDSQSRFIVEVYYIPAYIMLAIWAGYGIYSLMEKPGKYIKAMVFLPCIPLLMNFGINDMSRYHVAHDYGMNILNTMEKDSIFFCSGDNQMFILAYLKMAEKVRPDITVYTDTGFVFENIYGVGSVYLPPANTRDRVQLGILHTAKRPLYCALGSNITKFESVRSVPDGIIYRVVRDGSRYNSTAWDDYSIRGVFDEGMRKDYLNRGIVCQYYYFLGEKAFYNNDEPGAKDNFRKASMTGHDIPWVQNNVSAFLSGKGMFDEIIETGEALIAKYPGNDLAYSNIGFAYSRKGDFTKAEEYLVEAITLKPGSVTAMRSLASILFSSGRYDEAIREYAKIIELNPKSDDAYMGIGGVYFNRKDYKQAVEFYEKAVAINNFNADAHNNLGVVYEKLNLFKESKAAYKTASLINPASPEYHYNLGVVFWKEGDWHNVVQEFEKALEIDPGLEKVQKFLPRARENAGMK